VRFTGVALQSCKPDDLALVVDAYQPCAAFHYLDTQIAMVEAGEGIAIIPSFVMPACRNRRVALSRLVNPVVHLDFCSISNRGKELAPGGTDFVAFLKSYIARWAGRAGIL
jgi:LysR family carnitine catabolism transcriptional activator